MPSAFEAAEYKLPLPKLLVIGRQSNGQAAHDIAEDEGYNLIEYRNEEGGKVVMKVTPAYRDGEVPGCPTCALPEQLKPNHYPSPYCQSGKRPHCSCGDCF